MLKFRWNLASWCVEFSDRGDEGRGDVINESDRGRLHRGAWPRAIGFVLYNRLLIFYFILLAYDILFVFYILLKFMFLRMDWTYFLSESSDHQTASVTLFLSPSCESVHPETTNYVSITKSPLLYLISQSNTLLITYIFEPRIGKNEFLGKHFIRCS